MALTADQARSGMCGGVLKCEGKPVLTTRVKVDDEKYEYNAFCAGCLDLGVEYVQQKSKEIKPV